MTPSVKPSKPASKPVAESNGKMASGQPLIRLVEDQKWYEHEYNEKNDVSYVPDKEFVAKYEDKAGQLLRNDCALAASSNLKSDSGASWISHIIKSGTHSDKMSAIQLRTQVDPVHSLSLVQLLVAQVEKKQLRETVPVVNVLRDLFIDIYLPPTRKLVAFSSRPVHKLDKLCKNNSQLIDKRLCLWKFESDLKALYDRFIQALQATIKCQIEKICVHTVRVIGRLLAKRPEQEQALLSTLTNNVTHPKKSVASAVSDALHDVTDEHPVMRNTVIDEVEQVVFRKNVPLKAQLYATHYLSRIRLYKTEEDAGVALKLLKIYFSLFKLLIFNENEDHRLMAIVMIGANRALPYVKDKVSELMPDIDNLYKLVYAEKFSIALAALKVLYQMLNLSSQLTDRFYSAFYRRLATVESTAHDTEFFLLAEKVISGDTVRERVRAIIKRLLQVAASTSAAFAAAALLLYNKVIKERPEVLRVKKSANLDLMVKTEKTVFDEDDDEEEHYEDVQEEDADSKKKVAKKEVKLMASTAGWLHRRDGTKSTIGEKLIGYNPDTRNPLFANAEGAVDTELYTLAQHYHPTVALFAQNIIDGVDIKYSGEPLQDFSLIRFLDRFAFKNPKKNVPGKNTEKSSSSSIFSHNYRPRGVKNIGPTSMEYVKKEVDAIPLDERFLHRFAQFKMGVGEEKKEDDFDDIASIASDEFDMLLDRFEPGEANDEFEVDFSALYDTDKKKKRRKGADSDEEDDDDDSDVDEAEFMYSDDDEDEEGDGFDAEDGDDDLADFEGEDDEDDDGMDDFGKNVDDDEDEEEEDEFDEEEEEKSLKQKKLAKHEKNQKGTRKRTAGVALNDQDDDGEGAVDDDFFGDAVVSAEQMGDFADSDEESAAKKKAAMKRKVKKPKGFKKHKKR